MSKRSEIIRRELDEIAQRNGGVLMPVAVVDAARPKSSPLHSRFEWDDTAAAQAHRLWQARQLISITLHVCERTQSEEQVWVSLKPDRMGKGGYRSLITVLSDDEMRGQLLEDALEDMQIFERKYRHLRELAGVFAEMRAVRRKRKAA
jgi:hypothetical protein